MSRDTQLLVDRWRSEVEAASAPDAQALRDRLAYLKVESIGRGIRALVHRHLGPTDAREVTKLYATRSRLVHNGLVPDDIEAVSLQTAALVARLLARILSAGQR